MSLDVPYGDCFNVVIRDKYTVEGSTIMMERSFGLEWVKSTMMKSMIETNVPGNLVKDAEVIATQLKRWVSNGGPPVSKGQKMKEGLKRLASKAQGAASKPK